jgi:hypothetical protein
MDALLAFAAALVSLRLAALALRRGTAAFRAWAAGLGAYAIASGALAWGAAAGWDARAFRAYYLFGALLTAPLLGLGSLLLVGRRSALAPALVYVGFAVGVAVAAPVHGSFGAGIPGPGHFGTLPHALAIAANSVGTAAVAGVALATLRRRPLGNALILAGVATAAAGSAAGAGEAATAATIAAAAVLLYLGFVSGSPRARSRAAPGRAPGSA